MISKYLRKLAIVLSLTTACASSNNSLYEDYKYIKYAERDSVMTKTEFYKLIEPLDKKKLESKLNEEVNKIKFNQELEEIKKMIIIPVKPESSLVNFTGR